ncbi:hypothetical protein [Nonomuraea sp. NPDC049695]
MSAVVVANRPSTPSRPEMTWQAGKATVERRSTAQAGANERARQSRQV